MLRDRRRRYNRKRQLLGLAIAALTAATAIVGERVAAILPSSWPGWLWLLLLPAVLVLVFSLTERLSRIADTATARPPPPASDALADAVRDQWIEEAVVRALEYPASIRVRFRGSERQGVASAEAVLGEPVEGEPHTYRINGDISSIAQVFNQELPRQQLCVLGKPGGGKSVLVLLLTLRLLEDRGHGNPVPVLLSLSSWDPRSDQLLEWLERRVGEEYPFLTRTDDYGTEAPKRLVDERLILPVLDGLDEIAAELRPSALASIERTLALGYPTVLTCRGEEFDAAVAAGVFLTATPVIELEDVHPDDARTFLIKGTVNGFERWGPVIAELKSDPNSPAAKALTTPLMLWLARKVFEAPDENPAMLLNQELFPTPVDVQRYLLDAFVPAAYSHDPPARLRRRRFRKRVKRADAAERYLTGLAVTLFRNRRKAFTRTTLIDDVGVRSGRGRLRWSIPPATDFDFSWWETYRAVPNLSASAVALIAGTPFAAGPACIILALSGTMTERRLIAIGGGVFFGVLVATFYRPRKPGRISFQASLEDLKTRLLESVQLGAMAGAAIFVSLLVATAVTGWSSPAIVSSFAAGLVGGFGIALTGLLNGPVETIRAQDPERVLAADRTVAAATAVLGGATAFVAVAPGSGLSPGLAAAAAAGIAAAIGMSSWGWFFLARIYFWAIFWSKRRLPAGLITFLDDGHVRGVLRQSGSAYQFRHRLLQERLNERAGAALPTDRGQAFAHGRLNPLSGRDVRRR